MAYIKLFHHVITDRKIKDHFKFKKIKASDRIKELQQISLKW
jgi:hypothetical protein